MEPQLHDVNVLWTRDLAVGSASMDERNRVMFAELSAAEDMVTTASAAELARWLGTVFDRLEQLLEQEEAELVACGYREVVFHRQLHKRVRDKVQLARLQVDKAVDARSLGMLARETCSMLAVWLMRHLQDADRLFLPYIDGRYRGSSP